MLYDTFYCFFYFPFLQVWKRLSQRTEQFFMLWHKSTAFLNGYMLRTVIIVEQLQSKISCLSSTTSFHIYIRFLRYSFKNYSSFHLIINTLRSKEFSCKLTSLQQRSILKVRHLIPENHLFSFRKQMFKFTFDLHSLINKYITNKTLPSHRVHWTLLLKYVYFYRDIYVRKNVNSLGNLYIRGPINKFEN